MFDQADLPDLNQYPQPEWNRSTSVIEALNEVMSANDEGSSSNAYNTLLYTLGNNHAGTYYPVVLAVIPALESILVQGQPWPQHTVLNALIDLCGPFEPEFGYDDYRDLPVTNSLIRMVAERLPLIDQLAQGEGLNAQLARHLCELINEQMTEF